MKRICVGYAKKHEPTNGKTMKCSTCEMVSYLVLVSVWWCVTDDVSIRVDEI